MFDNVKLKYKQETNLSDTKLVTLQKIHERKIKLTTIKVQLRRNETKGIQSHAYRLTGQWLSCEHGVNFLALLTLLLQSKWRRCIKHQPLQ